MSFPLFRATLSNPTFGSVVINEPGGWDQAVLKLERNEEYHSLVEFYDQPMLFYGQGGSYNGGYTYVKAVEAALGPDAQIRILIEISEDGGTTYETAYDGLIDITSIKESDFYKLESGVIRNDFWQKFINRKTIPVPLAGTTDLDGGTRTAISTFTLSLPSQKIRKTFYGTSGQDITYTLVPAANYAVINMDTLTYDEITQRFDYPFGTSATVPFEMFTFEDNGSYAIDIHLYINDGGTYPGSSSSVTTFDAYVQLVQSGVTTTTAMTRATHGANPTTGYTDFTYTSTQTFKPGDTFTVYFKNTSGAPNTFQWIKFFQNYISITADTTYPDSSVEAYQIGDACQNIIQKITGQNGALYSNTLYVGGPGCSSLFALTKGINVRGYSFSAKPFAMSFDDWWQGANPIFGLGLGYKTISGTNYIEIERIDNFFSTSTTLNLDYVNFIERSYDTKHIYKSIEIGYEKWQAESGGGIDDPQTKHTYRTRFKTVGEDVKLLSKFYAASLGIEQTRRNQVTTNKDWRLDEEIFIIALKASDTTKPELDEKFTTVTNLLNSSTRYNIRLTPGRAFLRNRIMFNGCLKWYTTDNYTYADGEGNVAMQSDIKESVESCDSTYEVLNFAENQDIDQSNADGSKPFLFYPILYTFEHPLTWAQYKAIRDHRNQAIGVSRTASGHVPCHIMSLEYHVTEGKAKFTVAPATTLL